MRRIVSLSLAFCFAVCMSVSAQDARMTPGLTSGAKGMKANKPMGSQDGAKGDAATCDGEECPIVAKAMESLPKMVFRVGSEETCCHMTATRMAHESHEKMVYLVGKKKFNHSEDAFESLVKQTEAYVKKFVSPKVCEESGATTLAGETCNCPVTASKMTDSVVAATKDIKLSYCVGEKSFEKLNDAKRFARKSHLRGQFVVGDEKFENEMEARLALAHKKFRSAVTAVQTVKSEQTKTVKPEAKEEAKTESKDG